MTEQLDARAIGWTIHLALDDNSPKPPMITLCPYSLKPLADLPAEKLSDEHIIPHALGGPNSLVLRAERSSNSKFGETVDSDLVHDGMLRFVAASRSDSRSAMIREACDCESSHSRAAAEKPHNRATRV
jgi:hypothetical protein